MVFWVYGLTSSGMSDWEVNLGEYVGIVFESVDVPTRNGHRSIRPPRLPTAYAPVHRSV